MSEQNKLIKMVTDSAVLVGLTAGVGYLAKKILKENFLGDPSSNVMNYAKFTGVLAGSMALKLILKIRKYFQNLFKMASYRDNAWRRGFKRFHIYWRFLLGEIFIRNKTDQERRRHDKALERYQRDLRQISGKSAKVTRLAGTKQA